MDTNVKTYVFSIKIVDTNNTKLTDTYVGDARIHLYENTNVEAALTDLQNEVGGGYEIVSMYAEPVYNPNATSNETPTYLESSSS